jgi:hypothetical protein
VSENFPDKDRAAAYAQAHDNDAARYSRHSAHRLADEERAALAASGGQRILGGPSGRDELVASILELRYPLIAEARAVLAEPEPEPEAPAFAMSDENILKLVQEDSSSDYNEGVGPFGGYVDWHVEKGVLTVKVRPYTADADDDPSGPIVRKWRLVPVIDWEARKPRPLDKNERNWFRHLLQELSEHARSVRNAVEPETGVLRITDKAWAEQWAALTAAIDSYTSDVLR